MKVNAVTSLSHLRRPVIARCGSSPSRRVPRDSLSDSCGVSTEMLEERNGIGGRIGLAPQGRGGGECGAVGVARLRCERHGEHGAVSEARSAH